VLVLFVWGDELSDDCSLVFVRRLVFLAMTLVYDAMSKSDNVIQSCRLRLDPPSLEESAFPSVLEAGDDQGGRGGDIISVSSCAGSFCYCVTFHL